MISITQEKCEGGRTVRHSGRVGQSEGVVALNSSEACLTGGSATLSGDSNLTHGDETWWEMLRCDGDGGRIRPSCDHFRCLGLHGQLYMVLLASVHFSLGVEASGYSNHIAYMFCKIPRVSRAYYGKCDTRVVLVKAFVGT